MPKKTEMKKKLYQQWLKLAVSGKGLMNAADGVMKPRGSFPNNSMQRDYNGGRQ